MEDYGQERIELVDFVASLSLNKNFIVLKKKYYMIKYALTTMLPTRRFYVESSTG